MAFSKKQVAGLKAYPVRDGGWLSPNGDYYPSPHRNHDSITPLLAMAWYGIEGDRRILEERGWALVKHDGVVWFEDITQAQVDALAMLLPTAPTSQYRSHLLMGIGRALAALDGNRHHWQTYVKDY